MFKAHHRHYAAGFLLDCGVMVSFTAMPFFIFNQMNGQEDTSGTIAGIQAVAYGAVCLMLAGPRSPLPRLGLRASAIGTALFGIFFCGAVFAKTAFWYSVWTTVGMCGMAMVWPALHAWIGADTNLRRRNRRMSRFNLSWSLGFSVGPFLGGVLYVIDYRLPFLVTFLFTLATFIILVVAPEERRYFGAAPAERSEEHLQHDRDSEVHLYAAWGANLVANALVVVARSVFPKRLEELVNTGQLRFFFESTAHPFLTADAATKFMWLAAAMAAANALTFFAMGRSRWWHYRFSMLAGMQVVAGLAFWALAYTHSLAVMLVCCAAVGIAWGGSFFAAVFYSVANPALKHRRASVNEAGVGLGGFLGGILFSYFARHYGLVTPFIYTPAAIGAALLLQYALLRYSSRRQRILDAARLSS
jgi:MFS family permease